MISFAELKGFKFCKTIFCSYLLFVMRNYYILLILLILTSCKSENQLEGTWIGAFKIHNSGDEPSFSTMRGLLEISKNSIVAKTFDYPMFEEKDSIRISKYSINENMLIFDSDTFLIKGITEDSLILSIRLDYELDFVFKRLPKNSKNHKIDIKNNAFSLIAPGYSDSIDFINDSLIYTLEQSVILITVLKSGQLIVINRMTF